MLEAADRLLRANPAATLEEIAQESGASRATIYRRFPTRNDLLIALSRWAVGRIVTALEGAQIGAAPAEDALFRATRNVIEVKVGLEFARTLAPADDPIVSELQTRMRDLATALLTECQTTGIINSDADLDWALTVFYALVHEAAMNGTTSDETTADQMATRVVDTLLHGLGTPTSAD
ncbi:TetR/AcrR family transcriptional regulator [Micropruina sp.]|uniref:TetR/AcrR family transcriptional regulator n=1 Tax=Micropruina sp. TaxID=2737536 RepID=UPI0039E47A68